jgi:hypothetical protein
MGKYGQFHGQISDYKQLRLWQETFRIYEYV